MTPVRIARTVLFTCALALSACKDAGDSRPAGPSPASAPAAAAAADPWFEDVLATSGITFSHVSGHDGNYWFPEIAVGGACLLDIEGDGDLDIYFVQSGHLSPGQPPQGNQLYRNDGGFRFTDITAEAGVGDTGYGSGCTAGDFDGDGDIDLYVTNVGPNVLYRNDGTGRFTDVTAASGTGDPAWSSSAGFFDHDADGDLDLFVVNYIHWSPATELTCFSSAGPRDYCSPKNYKSPARDTLYENLGDGTFRDISVEAGLESGTGNGLGLVFGDFDSDGTVDIFVANDGDGNHLWTRTNGRFEDRSLLLGVKLDHHGWAEASMGVQALDLEGDGDLDIFVTTLHEETNTLYLNQGRSGFTETTSQHGLAVSSVGTTGWGLGFVDFDHDGHLDLYIANGRVKRPSTVPEVADPYAELSHLYKGGDGSKFTPVSPRGGTTTPAYHSSRAAAFGDLDGDGAVDIVVANRDAPPRILRNIVGSRGRFIGFRVLSARGTDALGASVSIEAGGRRQVRRVDVTYSYCASNDPRVHFGVGPAEAADSVIVRWPSGVNESFGQRPSGSWHVLREGEGVAAAP